MPEQLVKKKLFLITLIAVPQLQAASPSKLAEWKKRYYLDKQGSQEYLGITASFIAYLMRQEPSEKIFNHELELVKKYYPKAPNYLQLALTKVYKNAYLQAYKEAVIVQATTGEPIELTKAAWKQALLAYYQTLFPLLKDKAFNYGCRKGKTLKTPEEIRKRIESDGYTRTNCEGA